MDEETQRYKGDINRNLSKDDSSPTEEPSDLNTTQETDSVFDGVVNGYGESHHFPNGHVQQPSDVQVENGAGGDVGAPEAVEPSPSGSSAVLESLAVPSSDQAGTCSDNEGPGNSGLSGSVAAGGEGRRESISHRRKFSAPHLTRMNSRSEEDLERLRIQWEEGRKRSMPESEAGRPAQTGGDRRMRQRSRTYGPGDGNLPGTSGAGGGDQQMTEGRVAAEAEEIIHSFMVSSYQRDLRHEYGEPEGHHTDGAAASPGFVEETPNIPELTNFPGNPLSPATLVGRRLAQFGDEFQERYESDLDDMVGVLLPHIISTTSIGSMIQEAYDSFRSVAMRIFAQGGITWGRIIALFCFGYRMGVALFRHGVRNFVGTVVRLIIRFLIGETIAQSSIIRWIADRGGWAGAFNYRMDAESMEGVLQSVANNWFRIISAASLVLWVWGALTGSHGP